MDIAQLKASASDPVALDTVLKSAQNGPTILVSVTQRTVYFHAVREKPNLRATLKGIVSRKFIYFFGIIQKLGSFYTFFYPFL
jgi:hypothetical protein